MNIPLQGKCRLVGLVGLLEAEVDLVNNPGLEPGLAEALRIILCIY